MSLNITTPSTRFPVISTLHELWVGTSAHGAARRSASSATELFVQILDRVAYVLNLLRAGNLALDDQFSIVADLI